MTKFLHPPALSTSFSRSGKAAKKRFENIFDRSPKKCGKLSFLIAVTGILSCSLLTACGSESLGIIGGADGPTNVFVTSKKDQPEKAQSLDRAISAAILKQGGGSYLDGECAGEGHILLDSRKEGDRTIAYILATYGQYGFQNNTFVKISGSGVIPAKLTFDANLNLISYEEPEDGSGHAESLKKLFPGTLYHAARNSDEKYQACLAQERSYAQSYLDSIGRDAKIAEYADLNVQLLDLEAKVSNALLDQYYDFPYWIGSEEKIEDGVRYIYQTEQFLEKPGISTVTYTKKNYDTGEIVRQYRIHTDGTSYTLVDEKTVENRSKQVSVQFES